MVDSTPTIDAVILEINRIKREFDLVYVNYSGLLKSKNYQEKIYSIADVSRKLKKVAVYLNCTVMSHIYFDKLIDVSNNNVIKAGDYTYCFEVARISSVILSINYDEQESKDNQMRIYLEKQRHGRKNIQFGVYTDFSRCNLSAGEYHVVDKFN